MDKDCDTAQSSRILVLWLDLREAMEAAKRTGSVVAAATPWRCADARASALWEHLTRPENEHALREWLLVVGPGQDEAWAHEAIRECQRRKADR